MGYTEAPLTLQKQANWLLLVTEIEPQEIQSDKVRIVVPAGGGPPFTGYFYIPEHNNAFDAPLENLFSDIEMLDKLIRGKTLSPQELLPLIGDLKQRAKTKFFDFLALALNEELLAEERRRARESPHPAFGSAVNKSD